MSDFMLWLHANYIQPQINAVEKDYYETHFYRVEKELSPAARQNLEYVLEFTAIQAFLLGFRTSEGLTPLTARTPAPAPLAPLKRVNQE